MKLWKTRFSRKQTCPTIQVSEIRCTIFQKKYFKFSKNCWFSDFLKFFKEFRCAGFKVPVLVPIWKNIIKIMALKSSTTQKPFLSLTCWFFKSWTTFGLCVEAREHQITCRWYLPTRFILQISQHPFLNRGFIEYIHSSQH